MTENRAALLARAHEAIARSRDHAAGGNAVQAAAYLSDAIVVLLELVAAGEETRETAPDHEHEWVRDEAMFCEHCGALQQPEPASPQLRPGDRVLVEAEIAPPSDPTDVDKGGYWIRINRDPDRPAACWVPAARVHRVSEQP